MKNVKIEILTATHEHAGESVPLGTVLEVDEATAAHFVEIKAAKLVESKKGKGE